MKTKPEQGEATETRESTFTTDVEQPTLNTNDPSPNTKVPSNPIETFSSSKVSTNTVETSNTEQTTTSIQKNAAIPSNNYGTTTNAPGTTAVNGQGTSKDPPTGNPNKTTEDQPQWKKTMKTYTQNFTLHGLTRVLHGQLWEQIFWGSILSVLCVLIMIHVSGQMSKYLEYGIYTNFEIRYKGEVTFPSVTICDKSIIYQPIMACNMPLEEESTASIPICSREERLMHTRGSLGEINSDGVYQHPLFKINVETYNKHLEKVKMNYFESLPLYRHRCVTWNPTGNVTKGKYGLAIMSIDRVITDFDNIMEIVAIAHGAGEYFDLSDAVTASTVPPGASQRLNLKTTYYERLPKPYPSQCRDARMPESATSIQDYSRKLCLDMRVPITELENCGSVDDYFYPFVNENLIKKYHKDQTFGEFNECRQALKRTDTQTNKLRECDPPCIQTQVKTSIEMLGMDEQSTISTVMIKLVNSDTMDYVVEKKLYEWNIMIADMGGLIGLLNGSSICSAFEIVIAVSLFIFGKKHMAELLYHQHLEQHLHLHHGPRHSTVDPSANP